MAIALGLLAAAGVLYGLWLWPAYRFLRQYRAQTAAGAPLRRTERAVAGTTIHIYDAAERNGTVLIVIPGLHPNGIFDPRFVAFANTCSEAGFQVIAPDVEEYRNFHLSKSTFQKAESLMEALPGVVDLQQKRLGVLGISYGAGPAFLIASKRKVNFVVSIGGYYNLEHAIEFSFSGVHGNAKRKAHEWGRLIFALNHANEVLPEPDSQILAESLHLRLQLKEKDAALKEAGLSDAGKTLLDGILNGLTQQQTELFREVARKQKAQARVLSPETFLNSIDRGTVLYLLHGVWDDSIPYEESIELRDAATKAGFRTHCLVTTGLTHVDVTSPSHLVEFVKLLHWIRSLLREC